MYVALCETHTQGPTYIVTLRSPGTTSPCHFSPRVSGGPVSDARGQAGVGISVSVRADRTLLDYIIDDSRLCAV